MSLIKDKYGAPWFAAIHMKGNGSYSVYGDGNYLVADVVQGHRLFTTKERAQLIAAAPELLEALQSAVNELTRLSAAWDFPLK